MLRSARLERIWRQAQDAARARGHAAFGCEHVMLAMTDDKLGWPVDVLVALDVLTEVREAITRAVDDLRHALPASLPADPPAAGGGRMQSSSSGFGLPATTPRLRQSYARCVELGISLGQEAVGPEHLLVAFAEDEYGVVRRVLDDLGVAAQVVKRGRRFITSEGYNERGQCIVISADNRYLGLPVIRGHELWVKRPTGKIVPYREA